MLEEGVYDRDTASQPDIHSSLPEKEEALEQKQQHLQCHACYNAGLGRRRGVVTKLRLNLSWSAQTKKEGLFKHSLDPPLQTIPSGGGDLNIIRE